MEEGGGAGRREEELGRRLLTSHFVACFSAT
jgi:hypothetical protein